MAYKSIRIKEETYEDLKGVSNDWELSLDETVVKLLARLPAKEPPAPPRDNGLPFTSEQIDYLVENFVGMQLKEIEGVRLGEIEGMRLSDPADIDFAGMKPVEPDWVKYHRRASVELPKEMQEALEYCQDPDARRDIEKEYKEKIDGYWAMYHSLKPTRKEDE